MFHTITKRSYVMVGLSGGVDSSVAAYLLKQAGHQVIGVFMKNWQGDDTDNFCSQAQDLRDAEAICDKLKIELVSINFADQYWQRVFTHFLSEYQAGRTPNPDILCNKEIKFRAFLDYAKNHGADYIATGHYAQNPYCANRITLQKSRDLQKDQSYFLHALSETQLTESLFPVGHLEKSQVRQIAKELDFTNHDKKDSTGICFIGERKFKAFLQEYLPAKPGNIVTLDGEIIGKHDGLMYYTIGQRQGLQIGGKRNKLATPWYVADKKLSSNTLIVVQGANHPALFQSALTVHSIHWINQSPRLPASCYAKTRYRQTDAACQIEPVNDKTFRITFTTPQRAITPGQSIVFYQGAICLGGGIIETCCEPSAIRSI